MSERMVTVCSECLRASCWQGSFMCDESRTAGTVEKTVSELSALNLENPEYWEVGASGLLPCPFCGGECKIAEWSKGGKDHFTANCTQCDATATDCADPDEAAAYWNTRHESRPVVDLDATRPQPGIPPEGGKAMDAFLAGTKHARVAAAPSPAVAPCAPQGEAVRALVAKWRKRWKELTNADRVGAFEVDGLQNCADELEAALGRELAGQGRDATSASPATPPVPSSCES